MTRVPITALLVALAGCAGAPPTAPPAPPPVAPHKAPLLSEQRRLAELFRGTPVVFAMQADGSLRVEVPLHFCFDPGRAEVKPPLAAVLDRVAKSQLGEATRLRVGAPSDPASKGAGLAAERASNTRKYMVERGISATRFVAAEPVAGGNVRIIVADPPPP
jgi:outer membrane protein OmpA-like peptidoglycan-associated protein